MAGDLPPKRSVDHLQLDYGFEIEIHKKIKVGSGIGRSATKCRRSRLWHAVLAGNPLTKKNWFFSMIG